MHFFHLLFGASRLFVKMTTDPPSCLDCIHYIPDKQTVYSVEKQCRKFIQIDNLTGVITHRDALNCRINDDLCGLGGEYFEPKSIPKNISPAKTPVVVEYTEEQMVKIRLGLFVCNIVFNTFLWVTLIDLLYLHLWFK